MTPTHKALQLAAHLGYTGVEIARICGVDPVTVTRWKSKRTTRQPKYDVIYPLLVELGIIKKLD